MEKNEYQCAICRNIYAKGVSDDEANAEALDIWGVENASENESMAVICDNCFNRRTTKEIREMGNENKANKYMILYKKASPCHIAGVEEIFEPSGRSLYCTFCGGEVNESEIDRSNKRK